MADSHGTKRLVSISLCIFAILLIPVAMLFINNRPPQIKIPTHQMPKPNAWDGFVRAGSMTPRMPWCGPLSRADKEVKDWTVADYRADYPVFIQHAGPALLEMKKSLKLPYMHPPLRSSKDCEIIFPTYAKIRELARESASKALYENALDRPGSAMDSLLDVLDLGVTLPRDGGIMPNMVGVALEGIGNTYIDDTGVLDKLSSAELAYAAKRLDEIAAKRVSIGDVLREEGCVSAGFWMERVGATGGANLTLNPARWAETGSYYGGGTGVESFWIGAKLAFANKSALVQGKLHYSKALAAEQSRGYTGKSSVPRPHSAVAGTKRAMGTDAVSIHATHARAEANMTLLRTEIALRRFKLDHGSYPASLSELSPKYLAKPPIDPFGQKKLLCYRLTGGAKPFLLYSRGPDLTDDGGKPGKWDGKNTKGDLSFGAK